MNRIPDTPNEWSPTETFAALARDHGHTPAQLRARLAHLADQAGEERHLGFEVLRDFEALSNRGLVTPDDQAHLESCAFCSKLLATLDAPHARVEEFATAAIAAYERAAVQTTAPAPVPHSHFTEWRLAAGFLFVALTGLVAWQWQAPRLLASPVVARLSPALSVKLASDPSWSGIEDVCARETGEQSGCAYLSTAARFRANGKARASHTLLVTGLEEAGVVPLVAAKVGDALQTSASPVPKERQEAAQLARALVHNTDVPTRWIEAARLQLKAGEKLEALHAVDMYLVAVDTKPTATEAFRSGFVRTVAQLDSGTKPSLPATPSSAAAVATSSTEGH